MFSRALGRMCACFPLLLKFFPPLLTTVAARLKFFPRHMAGVRNADERGQHSRTKILERNDNQ